ncbi:MAG: DUF1648 domain-containing protein [Sphingobacteriales bacterium]|nr:MAG: DUF1648 domain-containing protein [Sphingobacteriales bacterium]
MNERPRIDLPHTVTDNVLEGAGSLITVLLWCYVVWFYPTLPAIVPIHFDGGGRPDGFGDKASLLILPGITTIIYILLTVLNRYPHTFNYLVEITPENAVKQYKNATKMIRVLKLGIALLFFIISYKTIDIAQGNDDGLGPWFLPAFIFGMLGTVGFFLWRGRDSPANV